MDKVANVLANDVMPLQSINDKPYQTRTSHTGTVARQSREYAELYDQWEGLCRDATRLREEADSKEERAIAIREKFEKIALDLSRCISVEGKTKPRT